jgi:hypothetical protein
MMLDDLITTCPACDHRIDLREALVKYKIEFADVKNQFSAKAKAKEGEQIKLYLHQVEQTVLPNNFVLSIECQSCGDYPLVLTLEGREGTAISRAEKRINKQIAKS